MKKRIVVMLLFVMVFALAAPAYAELTEEEAKAAVEAQGKEAVSGNLLIWFLCAIAFLKVSQKIDSFMAMLGINVGRTGGGAFSDIIVAMRGAMGLAKMAGGGIGSAFGSRSGSLGTASAGKVAGAGGLAGGLAGMISRQAVSKTAGQATTDTEGSRLMAGIGSKLYDSSLGEKNGFAQEVISSVATGDGGVMTGDKAVDAFNAYMGNSLSSVSSSVSSNEMQTGSSQKQSHSAQTQNQQNIETNQSVLAHQESASQQETIVSSQLSANGHANEEAGEIPYKASAADISNHAGSEEPSQGDANSVPEVSAAEVFGFADAQAVDYSTVESAVDMAAGGVDGITAETVSSESPVPFDYSTVSSGGIEGSTESYCSSSLPSGSGAESTGFAGTPSVGAETYAPVPTSASYKDIEIGRGQIRGTEVSDQNPSGIRFAMYHTEKYMKPESGNYATVQSADGAKWYKQYAEPIVKRTPISEQDGKVKQRENIVYELPKPPQRKDRV